MPDFFIVGAPKCGTTALVDYLKRHPGVFIPSKKELNYFGGDLRIRRRPRLSLDEYLDFYAGAPARAQAGDASVWSLYSPEAAVEIKALSPDARIVIMLRDPVEMMYALHAQNLYTGNEWIRDFATALAAEESRAQGRNLRGPQSLVDHLRYRKAARYAGPVQCYLDVFGPDRAHVIVFDDFAAATAEAYQSLCAFLAIDPAFRPDFDVINPSKRVRSLAVARLLKYTAPPIRTGRPTGVQSVWRAVRSGLRRWNATAAPRPAMDPALRHRLQAEFRPEVERLGQLLGRDLSAWTAPDRPRR